MPHFRVHELLDRSELDQLEAFAREPGRTVDQCVEWLEANGFVIARSSVHRWKRGFDATDKFRASNEVAAALMEAARSKDAVAISDAAALQLSQLLFEQTLRMQGDGEIQTKDLWAASMAVKNVIASLRGLERHKQETAERNRTAVEEARKVAGAGGEAVIDKVREILGV